MHSDLQTIYDRFADTYEKNRNLFDMTGVIADFSQRLPGLPGHLLDLGCGAGEPFPAYFIGQGWQVTGVDFSARMLEMAHRYQPAMKTILNDITEVEFPDEQFDAVTAIYCLFHIEHRKHEEIFQKIYRWLKPGGKSLFTYATKEYTGAGIFNGYKEFMGEQLFYSHTTPDNLYADLKSVGFTIESALYRRIGGETFLWVTIAKP
ncbi:MAG: class I SAM-dependent methyltransferase [Deltaproteobacteria bacterium HGW-Deltaproteobacteria-6]|jgi:ubiquinone/menaquinone biosynthesis C-methylase UbiE|nr:MAG: class I SAM-dependent methyltransferase [Deltaproteobacteria bacterium HGW-Deltaproteobacteria-6]